MSELDRNPVSETDLAEFDEVFTESEETFESVPDGKYQAVVERVELVRTAKGDPMLKWTLRISGPTHEDRLIWRNNVMASADNIAWLKKDLYACGLKLAKLSELPANLERLLDIHLEVTKRTKGDFESIYINKRIRTADEEAPAEPSSKPAGKPSAKAREALRKF